MEKFVQLISGGLEMQDLLSSFSTTSHAHSLLLLWLNMHFLDYSEEKEERHVVLSL